MGGFSEIDAGLRPYPDGPGSKTSGTSRDAAKAIAAGSADVREQVYAAIAAAEPFGLTADQAAAAVERKPSYVRPRCSELIAAGRIVASGARRRNESGLSANVYRIVP
jgi:hypothetical protein